MAVKIGGRGPGHSTRSSNGLRILNGQALSSWQAAVANRNSAPAVLVVNGDSIAEGYVDATTVAATGQRWIDVLRNELYAKYPVAGVTPPASSYVPAFRGNNSTAWTLIGAPVPTAYQNAFGLGLRAGTTATVGSGFEITMDCTSISLHYIRGVSFADCKVEAFISGAYTTVGTFSTAGVLSSQVWNSGAFSGPATKIKITANTAANFYLEGVRFYNGDEAKGFHVLDASHFGYTLNSYSSNGTFPYTPLAFIQPHLVIIPMTYNDFSGQTVVATYTTQMQSTLTSLRSIRAGQPVLLLAYASRGDVTSPTIPYSSYEAANAAVSAADTAGAGSTSAVAYVSLRGKFPDCPVTPTAIPPEFSSDRVHYTVAGHALAGRLISSIL